jgi:hypothetical protein
VGDSKETILDGTSTYSIANLITEATFCNLVKMSAAAAAAIEALGVRTSELRYAFP